MRVLTYVVPTYLYDDCWITGFMGRRMKASIDAWAMTTEYADFRKWCYQILSDPHSVDFRNYTWYVSTFDEDDIIWLTLRYG